MQNDTKDVLQGVKTKQVTGQIKEEKKGNYKV